MSVKNEIKFPTPEPEDNSINGFNTTVDVLEAVKENIANDNKDVAIDMINQLLNAGSGAFGPQAPEVDETNTDIRQEETN
jgi:hypothetical protein